MRKIDITEIAVLRSGKRGNEIKIIVTTGNAEKSSSVYRSTTGKNYYPIFKEVLPLTAEEKKIIVHRMKIEMCDLGFTKISRNTFSTEGLSKVSIVELIALIFADVQNNI